jgi:hypothetical protein
MEPTIRYYPETDTMAIELRPWPEGAGGNPNEIGGEDAGEDLVIHIPNISRLLLPRSGAGRAPLDPIIDGLALDARFRRA